MPQDLDEPNKVDTSDATAAADNIEKGKTAYVNGENYGTEVVNTDGTLSLGGTTGSVTVSSVEDLGVIKGKYVKPSSTYGTTTSGIYYIPEDATFTYSGSTYSKNCTVDKAHQMFVLA